MSGRSAKRRKTSAMAAGSVPGIASLPPELLEMILGFLDVRTLCTARIVCTQFHGAASRCLHSVELSVQNLRSRPETTLSSFPNVSRVTVFDVKEDDLLMLVQSPVAAAVTHLRAANSVRQVPRCGHGAARFPLLLLPNLMSLTVSHAAGRAFPFPQTLRELVLDGPVSHRTGNIVGRLTNLTCLKIDVGGIHKPFEAVKVLTALQRLEICSSFSVIPFVADLTMLTHLQLRETGKFAFHMLAPSANSALASLTCLNRLVHLGVVHHGVWSFELEHQLLATLGTFTGLRSLVLGLYERQGNSAFETINMRPFSKLTALRLEKCSLHPSFLPRFKLERLQDLALSYGAKLNVDGVAALTRATGLTHLQLCSTTVGVSVGPEELGKALSHMSRLRALSLRTTGAFQATCCSKAIGLLTDLTRLSLEGQSLTSNAVVEVCLGLKKLRVLSLLVPWSSLPAQSDPVTPAILFAIAKLPELQKFAVSGQFAVLGEGLTDEVRECLNAERHDRGWPPLEINISL